MKFNELYHLVESQDCIQESFLTDIRNIFLASMLGVSVYDSDAADRLKNISKTDPKKYNQIISTVNKKTESIKKQPIKKLEQIKKVVKQPDASKKIEQVLQQNTQVLPVDPIKSKEFLEKAKKYIEKNENHDLKIRNKWYKDKIGRAHV